MKHPLPRGRPPLPLLLLNNPPMSTNPRSPQAMTFTDYQHESRATAVYPSECAVMYCTLGLCGESGEVAEKVKKVIRDHDGVFDELSTASIKAELGDVLWYLTQVATELGLSLEDIASSNLQKLRDRQSRNALSGSGDRR